MAESTLSLTFNQLAGEIGHLLGFGRDTSTMGSGTGSQLDIVTQAIESGYRRFLFPPVLPGEKSAHRWSFMRPTTTLTTSASYSTGTIAIAAGVVTLTSGTWPSWVSTDPTDAEIVVSGAGYPVASYQSTTQVTLVDTSVTVSSGANYVISRAKYAAPDAFGGLNGPMTYRSSTSGAIPIELVPESEIRLLRQSQASNIDDKPCKVAVRPVNATATAGQRFEFLFWPNADAAYVVYYRYFAQPDMFATTQYPLAGMMHVETIQAAALWAAADIFLRDTMNPTSYERLFLERLRASVEHDRQMFAAERVGVIRDRSDEQELVGVGNPDYRVSYQDTFYS